ncbi:MAG: CRISPR-associated endonuclease Cas2 [Candidatus Doudnabacteria bacterium RIFCSPHIGHO2_01_FULL_46_14]|uniref:CRISPR-associated endonuclease Cas2 n=1 Tax=Candidatus Doudnabacteria bacterium RIFCSPHIGHO2_01_FULL_46_14 TaxID=1817824 RepID=A0A1F5NN44_9BACT|nr:MAG: CRISPR-associated endonuclease Cas2 [Candidatus Doudnabacteria bacterium RIFCSPHIGHO2_01_FULL_46_14]
MKNATMELLLDPEKYMEKYNRREIQRRLYYLKHKKFITFPARSPKGQVLLTKLGLRRLNQIKFQKIRIKRTVWDGAWRLLTFDIPEKNSGTRQTFRRKLKELGFFHFQRSVFVLPYECKTEIDLITDYLKITPCVHLLQANRFFGDKELIKKFNLHVP